MSDFTYELFALCALILLNGLLALAEAAVEFAQKTKLKALADSGDRHGMIAWEVTEHPSTYITALRACCTLIAIILGIVPGAWLGTEWTAEISHLWPSLAPHAAPFGIIGAIISVALIFLIFGELIPRRLAMAYPERIALWLAPSVKNISSFVSPVISIFSHALDKFLRFFGIGRPKTDSAVSDEEVNRLIEQGMSTGVFNKAEKEMVAGVLELDKLPVTALMTPRPKIVFLNIDDPDEINWRKIVASGHSYFPVHQGNRDQVVGMVAVKALWAHSAIGLPTSLKNLLVSPLVVPETMNAIHLLEAFKKAGKHIALVTDEFGAVQGLTTLIDVLEAIVGDIPSMGPRSSPAAKQREDGSWLIDATLSVNELKTLINVETLPDEDRASYQTVGGFIVTRLGRIPETGDTFDFNQWRFEVVDMDRHRVDKILLMQKPAVKALEKAAS